MGNAVVTPSARDAAHRSGMTLRASSAPDTPPVRRGAASARGSTKRPDTSRAAASPDRASTAPRTHLRVALGADHGGVALKDAIAARLRELGHDVTDVGTSGSTPVDYPDFAVAVARRVAAHQADVGIMVDGAGIGSCMAANKIPGVRAAMCYDVTTAQNAREHNDATVLTLGGGLLGARLALAIVETFLATPFAGGRHAPRVAKIDALDQSG